MSVRPSPVSKSVCPDLWKFPTYLSWDISILMSGLLSYTKLGTRR